MEYQKQMLALHLKANPKEVLVGWYATSAELNTFSALIQNFYGGQGDGTWPHPAVHLTVSTDPGKELEVRTYISAPVGVTAERAADSAAFIPVPYELQYGDAEKSGLEMIAAAKESEDRTTGIVTDIESLERAVEETLAMLDRVSSYVESVIDEEEPASTAIGQFLMNALALAPKVEPADIERDLYVVLLRYKTKQANTNNVTATPTFKTSSPSPTSPTPSARKWISPTASLLPPSPSAPAKALPTPKAKKKAAASNAAVSAAARDVAATATTSKGIKRPQHQLRSKHRIASCRSPALFLLIQ